MKRLKGVLFASLLTSLLFSLYLLLPTSASAWVSDPPELCATPSDCQVAGFENNNPHIASWCTSNGGVTSNIAARCEDPYRASLTYCVYYCTSPSSPLDCLGDYDCLTGQSCNQGVCSTLGIDDACSGDESCYVDNGGPCSRDIPARCEHVNPYDPATWRCNCNPFAPDLSGALCGSKGKEGINTAIGCIPVGSTSDLASWVLGWAIGIAGGIAFLLVIYAGFILITSAGNPAKVASGKELLTAAVSGLILLIFSAFLLRVIGVDILGIFSP